MNDGLCIFCRIAQKQKLAIFVYEDEKVRAFLDIKPLNEGHMLVIRKSHYETIFELSVDLFAILHGVTRRIALDVRKAVNADGTSISQQN